MMGGRLLSIICYFAVKADLMIVALKSSIDCTWNRLSDTTSWCPSSSNSDPIFIQSWYPSSNFDPIFIQCWSHLHPILMPIFIQILIPIFIQFWSPSSSKFWYPPSTNSDPHFHPNSDTHLHPILIPTFIQILIPIFIQFWSAPSSKFCYPSSSNFYTHFHPFLIPIFIQILIPIFMVNMSKGHAEIVFFILVPFCHFPPLITINALSRHLLKTILHFTIQFHVVLCIDGLAHNFRIVLKVDLSLGPSLTL